MADQYDSLAKRWGFPDSQVPQWRAMAGVGGAAPAPPAPPPVAPPLAIGPPALVRPSPNAHMPPGVDPSWGQPGPVGLPEDSPSLRAGLEAANRRPGQAPIPSLIGPNGQIQNQPGGTPPPKVNPADLRQPLKGDWKGHNEHVAKMDAERRKENLEGATFHEPGEEAPRAGPSMGGGPMLVDKGGRRPGAWQIHEGMDLGPDAKQASESASVRGYMANDLDRAAGEAAAEFERGYLEKHHQAAKQYAVSEAERADSYTRQVDEHMGKLDGLRQQIREAGPIKPFGNADPTIAQIGGAIAVGLGALAASRTGGRNLGLESFNNAVSISMRAQEEKLAKLERGARGEETFLSRLKETYGDKRAAVQAAHIAYLEQAKVELAKNLGDPSVAHPKMLAAYERMNAMVDDELVKRTVMFKGITEDRVIRHDVNAQPRYVGGAGFGAGAKGDARYLSEAYAKSGIPEALADLQGVDQVIDTFGEGDIEGVGRFASQVPDWAYGIVGSGRGVANRQAVASIKNRVRKSIAGASLTEGEKVELNKELEAAGDADSLRRSVQSVRRRLYNQQKNIGGGASPEGHALYRLQGGSVPDMRLDKGTTPTIREAK